MIVLDNHFRRIFKLDAVKNLVLLLPLIIKMYYTIVNSISTFFQLLKGPEKKDH